MPIYRMDEMYEMFDKMRLLEQEGNQNEQVFNIKVSIDLSKSELQQEIATAQDLAEWIYKWMNEQFGAGIISSEDIEVVDNSDDKLDNSNYAGPEGQR